MSPPGLIDEYTKAIYIYHPHIQDVFVPWIALNCISHKPAPMKLKNIIIIEAEKLLSQHD